MAWTTAPFPPLPPTAAYWFGPKEARRDMKNRLAHIQLYATVKHKKNPWKMKAENEKRTMVRN